MVTLYKQLMDAEAEYSVRMHRINRFAEVERELSAGVKEETKRFLEPKRTKAELTLNQFRLEATAAICKATDLQKTARQKRVTQQFGLYKENPILTDAVEGKQSVTESLEELASHNFGWKRFLPRKRNDEINQRVEQVGELINEPHSCRHRGYFSPDNIVTGTAYTAGVLGTLAFGLLEAFPYFSETPIEPESMGAIKTVMYGIAVPMLSILGGAAMQKARTIIPTYNQAQTIDAYIKELKQ